MFRRGMAMESFWFINLHCLFWLQGWIVLFSPALLGLHRKGLQCLSTASIKKEDISGHYTGQWMEVQKPASQQAAAGINETAPVVLVLRRSSVKWILKIEAATFFQRREDGRK